MRHNDIVEEENIFALAEKKIDKDELDMDNYQKQPAAPYQPQTYEPYSQPTPP